MTGADLPPPPPGSTPGGPSPIEPPAASVPPPPPPTLSAPSGYVGYTAAQGMRGQLTPVRTTGRWAMILAAVAGVAGLVSAFITAHLAGRAQDFLDGKISEDAFLDTNALAPLGQVLSGAPTIAAGVFGVIWMYRIAKNVRTLGRATTFAPVFAIVGWVMPPLLYIIPFLVLRELWLASDPDTEPGADGWRASGENPMLYAWFVAYVIVPVVLFALSFRSVLDATLNLDTDAESIAEAATATSGPMLILTGVVTLVGAALWILVVKQLTDRHVALTKET